MKILFTQDTDWLKRNISIHNHLLERMILRGHKIKVIDFELLWRKEKIKSFYSKKKIFHESRLFKKAKHQIIRPGILKIPFLDYLSMFYTYRKEIKNQLIKFRPDIIIGDGIITPFLAFNLAKKLNINTVYYCIDLDYRLIPFRILQPIGKIIESINIKKANFVLSTSDLLREYTIKMGANPKKTEVVRSGIDLEFFNRHINGIEIRKEFGIERNDILLLFVGWLYKFSGLKEVILSLQKLQLKNLKLLIVGEGDAYEDLQKIIKKYNIHNKIILTGRVPYKEIPKFIAASDICLLPAYNNEIMRYIVPIKMYEYMIMQKPVIATKLPGLIKEFGFESGVIYIDKPEDTIQMAINMINNNKIYIEGKKARNFAKDYGWDNIVTLFEKTLENI